MRKNTAVAFLIIGILLLSGCSNLTSNGDPNAVNNTGVKVQFTVNTDNAASAIANLLATPTPDPTPTPTPYEPPQNYTQSYVDNTVPVHSVSFDVGIYYVTENSTAYLPGITIEPSYATYKNVTIKSDNPAVASYNPGDMMIHTGSPGIANFSASTSNGATGFCTVVVTKGVVAVSSIHIAQPFDHDVILATGERKMISITVTPGDATKFTTTWTSSDPSVIELYNINTSNCSIAAMKPGSAMVTIVTNNGSSTSVLITVR